MKINPQPIFIMGTQRSGTTLLTRILSSHHDVFIQNEINIAQVFKNTPSRELILERITNNITATAHLSINDFLNQKNKSMWGVKDPQFTEHIESLKQFLPDYKFIIIVRDARAVVNSYINNKWGLGTNAYTGALRWLKEVKQQKTFMASSANNFLLIRYEDLVSNLEVELIKVCKHLNISFDPNMLLYYKTKANYQQNKSNIHTNEKPNIDFTKKWLQQLTSKQISIIEYVAGDELKANNYLLTGDIIVPFKWEKFYYKIHQTILGEIQIQYQLKKYWCKTKLKQFFSKKTHD
ncbi:MAG: hypothetical protein COB35_10820 [Gammaproteobacteria bacterium]|nr:MAG: hypothetical protein COB35_10820 [Gammaproteobacteria bacterium]